MKHDDTIIDVKKSKKWGNGKIWHQYLKFVIGNLKFEGQIGIK